MAEPGSRGFSDVDKGMLCGPIRNAIQIYGHGRSVRWHLRTRWVRNDHEISKQEDPKGHPKKCETLKLDQYVTSRPSPQTYLPHKTAIEQPRLIGVSDVSPLANMSELTVYRLIQITNHEGDRREFRQLLQRVRTAGSRQIYVRKILGAGSGNRTRTLSLEGSYDTISPYPLRIEAK